MAKNKKSTRSKKHNSEPDSIYFLKLILFFILGSIWIKSASHQAVLGLPGIPVGLIIGLFFSSHDHFQIDRKIEYFVLLMACVLSFVAPIGAVIFV